MFFSHNASLGGMWFDSAFGHQHAHGRCVQQGGATVCGGEGLHTEARKATQTNGKDAKKFMRRQNTKVLRKA